MSAPRRPSSPSSARIADWAEDAAAALPVIPEQLGKPLPAITLPIRPIATVARSEVIRGTSVTLSIPLDEVSPPKPVRPSDATGEEAEENRTHPPRRKVLRRDSLERREALLKGKEGSRRRQRWENDRLLNNPWAQPPLPSDWQVQPTHPRTVVPYFLAPLWEADAKVRARRMSKKQAAKARATHESRATVLPRDLREKLKKAKSARGLLMDLETEVRAFIEQWNKRLEKLQEEDLENALEDDSEEEIVFVGRNGAMRDVPPSPQAKEKKRARHGGDSSIKTPSEQADSSDDDMIELEQPSVLPREKLVFGGLADDQGASFARWIVHSIGDYYGLRTWSVNVGNPARREAYVGIDTMHAGRKPGEPLMKELPRPLWGLV